MSIPVNQLVQLLESRLSTVEKVLEHVAGEKLEELLKKAEAAAPAIEKKIESAAKVVAGAVENEAKKLENA